MPKQLADLTVGQYILRDATPYFPIAITLDRCPQSDGRVLWAIREGGACYCKEGNWLFEPIPSNRTVEFLDLCRWESAQAALDFWQRSGEPGRFEHYRGNQSLLR